MKTHPFHNLKGEQKNQILILVDKKGIRKGFATRKECHEDKGKPHLAFLVCIFDKVNNLILTRRNINKSLWGGYWDASSVSHVLLGETIEEAAERRTKEELGIKIKPKIIGSFYYFKKFYNSAENEYCHVLVCNTNSIIKPNPVEISEVKKISIRDLKKDISDKPNSYTPWLKIALERFDFEKLFPKYE